MDVPLVNILTCTYNHEGYISNNIEGVLMQNTNFKYAHFIGDDCSTDNTLKVLRRYEAKNPEVIKVVARNKNIGAQKNMGKLFNSARAKYIAILDGDDCWTDPHKLQTQVDFLEKNSDFSLIGHNVKTLDHINGTEKLFIKHYKAKVDIEDLILKTVKIPSLSMVFRNDFVRLPEIFYDIMGGDRLFALLLASKGKICLLNSVMGIQNKQKSSLTKNYEMIDMHLLQYNDNLLFNRFFDYQYEEEFSKIQAKISKRIFRKSHNLSQKLTFFLRWLYHSSKASR